MIYTIHLKPISSGSIASDADEARFDGLLAIPEARANWALIAPPIWLFLHTLLWELVVYLMVLTGLGLLLATPFWPVALFLGGIPGIYLWLEGNQLRRQKADRNGYAFVDVVEASSTQSALTRYLKNWRPDGAPKQVKPLIKAHQKSSAGYAPSGISMFPQEGL